MKSALDPTSPQRWSWAALLDSAGTLSAERCIEQGVAGLVYRQWRDASQALQDEVGVAGGRATGSPLQAGDLRPDTYSQLRKNYLHDLAAHQLRMARLEGIVQKLNRRGVRPLILRGPAVVEQLYDGDGGLRRYSDIDLCVLPKDHPVLTACLNDLGFKQDRLYPQIWKLDGLALDCHQDPINLSRNPCYDALLPGDIGLIFDRALPFFVGAARALVPSALDQLSLLAIHLVKHSFSQQIWEIDLVRCIERNFSGAQSELLRRPAERSRLLHFVLYFLWLKYHCLSEDFFDSLPPLPRLCRRLAACLTQNAQPGSGPIVILSCLPGRLRWRYLKSVLWPKTEVRNQIATDFKIGDSEGRFLLFRLADAAKRTAQLTMWFLRG